MDWAGDQEHSGIVEVLIMYEFVRRLDRLKVHYVAVIKEKFRSAQNRGELGPAQQSAINNDGIEPRAEEESAGGSGTGEGAKGLLPKLPPLEYQPHVPAAVAEAREGGAGLTIDRSCTRCRGYQ